MSILIGVLLLLIAVTISSVWNRRRGIPLFGRAPFPLAGSDRVVMAVVVLIGMIGVDFLSDEIQIWFQEIFSQSEAGFGLRVAATAAGAGVFMLLYLLVDLLLQRRTPSRSRV